MSGEGRSLGRSIVVLPALAAVAFLVVLALAGWAVYRNQGQLAEVQRGYVPAFELSRDLDEGLAKIQQALRDAVAASDSDSLEGADRLRDEVVARLEAARDNPVLDPAELDRQAQAIGSYYELARSTSERLIRQDTGEDLSAALEAMRVRYNAVRENLREGRERQKSEMVAAFDATLDAQWQGLWAMALAIGLAVIGLFVVSQRVVGQVVGPLRAAVEQAVTAAESIARGDLTARLAATSAAEVGPLLAAVGRMAENLRRMIGETRTGANDLAVAATQILTTTRATVEGAQNQAAAVQQTTATASELQQTVRVTEERARAIQQVMSRTLESSQAIRAQLGDAAGSMDRVRSEMSVIVGAIEKLAGRNLQIGEIIESVGDVADQTQLLAVNAGIEAAKAGDVGRGFAVVATEMKALADQSKRSSQRIRAIVAEVQQAAAEVTQVVATGEKRLEESVAPVSHVLPLVEQLTARVEESAHSLQQILAIVNQQIVGIGQITQAMKTIEGGVQQNLAMNRELERGAESLNALGQQLQGLVAEYRL